MKHLKNFNKFEKTNELFGFSKKEKEEKELKKKKDKAKEEIKKYDFSNLFKQPKKDSSNEELKNLARISLNNAKSEMPTLYELLPELFEGSGVISCKYPKKGPVYDQPVVYKNDDYISGIIPSNFYFLKKDGELIVGKESNEIVINHIEKELK